jgi:hypothetical protein
MIYILRERKSKISQFIETGGSRESCTSELVSRKAEKKRKNSMQKRNKKGIQKKTAFIH